MGLFVFYFLLLLKSFFFSLSYEAHDPNLEAIEKPETDLTS